MFLDVIFFDKKLPRMIFVAFRPKGIIKCGVIIDISLERYPRQFNNSCSEGLVFSPEQGCIVSSQLLSLLSNLGLKLLGLLLSLCSHFFGTHFNIYVK